MADLHFDVLSGPAALPDDIKYRFKFRESATTGFPWVKFKDLVITTRRKHELIKGMEVKAGRTFTEDEKVKIYGNLDLVDRTFKMDQSITYQELDSIDNPDLYTEDDVVEVFIRANSGGTKLEKSDLLFSLLNATWDVADNRMEELLDDLNRHGFAFDRDFVLKTCLVLLNQGAQYEVSKFRKPGVREEIEEKWDKLNASIKAVADFVRSKTYIQCVKALPSYLALIPLIYVRHHYPTAWATAKQVDTFLVRTLLAGAFSGTSDRIIDALVKRFKEKLRRLHRSAQAFLLSRYCNDMDVVGHEAVAKNTHPVFFAVLLQEIEVTHSFLVFKKDGGLIVSAMGNLVRNPW